MVIFRPTNNNALKSFIEVWNNQLGTKANVWRICELFAEEEALI